MRPTFMGFETATRGLMANQKSLDIVAHNATNIGVTGYTRQRVDLVSMSTNMRNTRYNQNSTSFAGQGVGIYGVSQLRDSFLDKRFREEYADVGYFNKTSEVLDDLSACMDEISPSTMKTAMQNFQNTWDELIKKGNDNVNGANAKAAATQIVQVFRQMSAKIENIWSQQEYNLKLEVEKVNSILENVASLNDIISQERFNSMDVNNPNYKPLELLDQRNILLDQLSEYADISYTEHKDGQITLKMGGVEVVDGKWFEQMSLTTNDVDDRTKTVSINWRESGEEVSFIEGGLYGALEMLNGRGEGATGGKSETFARGVLYYRDKIDQFSKTFAEAFNNVIEMEDPGNPGNPYDPPRYKQLFKFDHDTYNIAGKISLSDEWEKDASYVVKGVLSKITGGNDDNSFATQAKKVFDKELNFGEFKGNIYDYVTFYSVTKLGNDKSYSDNRLEAAGTVTDNLLNKIQGISGVSLEEEGVDMMMYKKAYDAVSRVFTTLDEMLDKLINGTGVVGR